MRLPHSSALVPCLFLCALLLIRSCPSPVWVVATHGSSPYPLSWMRQAQQNPMRTRLASATASGQALAQHGSSSSWQTLKGDSPLIIANGGLSGLFPDQTERAYVFATSSLAKPALTCDIQLTKDSIGICRTGIDLSDSTNVNFTFPDLLNTYTVNGNSTTGFFAIDLTVNELSNITAIQANTARSPAFDVLYPIVDLVGVSKIAGQYGSYVWVNVEYYSFFLQHKLDIAKFILNSLKDQTVFIDYLSSPEIVFLKAIKRGAQRNHPTLIFEFHGKQEVEPSTNGTYGSLLSNLTYVATFASGIVVPKDFIWPFDTQTKYILSQTTLLQEAHDAGLEIYASGFVNDQVSKSTYVPIYNYSFDPVREYLQYLPAMGPIVDGFMTDFPTTASESIACFRNATPLKGSALKTKPLVISHNGASGDFPGCTLLAYKGAVEAGASFIDCRIQITKDSVPICRESPNLLTNTDIASHSNFLSRLTTIPALQEKKGAFSFNFTWDEIKTLKAIIYSPEGTGTDYHILRNTAFDHQESILSLSDFLAYAKNVSTVGILIDIQNGYFLQTQLGFGVVDIVLKALSDAGLGTSDRVLVQSEDSGVLQRVKLLSPYECVYRVLDNNVSITKAQVEQIKALAPSVTLPRVMILDMTTDGFLLNASDVVDLFHASNMSVYVSHLRNEFVSLAFDYQADPTLEIHSLVQIFKVDGLITDFPATARAYLNNACLNPKTEPGRFNYSLFVVNPGDLLYHVHMNELPPTKDPSKPALNVTDNEVALGPVSPIQGSGSGPEPSPLTSPASRAAALPHIDFCVLLLLLLAVVSMAILLLPSS